MSMSDEQPALSGAKGWTMTEPMIGSCSPGFTSAAHCPLLTAYQAFSVFRPPDPVPAPTTALLTPDELHRLDRMELRARHIVEGFMTGLHRSPYHGFSV